MHELNTATKSIEPTDLAIDILQIIMGSRRLLEAHTKLEQDWEKEMLPHLPNVEHAINNNLPVNMVLPGFPAKSPSRKKTLGHLPDFGEELAMKTLDSMCSKIDAIYENGSKVTVCSDGRVFADVVRIPESHVTEYNMELRKRYKDRFNGHIDFFDLDDVYPGITNYDLLREELMIAHGEALESLRQRCKTEPDAGAMYKGITRFLFEDYNGLSIFDGESKTTIQKLARESAYRVIQRSNAWGRLVAQHLPTAVRLSIHPQPRISTKIGVNLVQNDQWATPWHSVVLANSDGYTLMPRHEAENIHNVALIFENGQPSYYRVMS
jgi:pyoverdine/dityrosine biosynthesis protein Dit1